MHESSFQQKTAWFHVDVAMPDLEHTVLALVQRYACVRAGRLSDEALEQIAGRPSRFAGLIVQARPADASRLRRALQRVTVPVLALLESPDSTIINVLGERGGHCLVLPVADSLLRPFVVRAIAQNLTPNGKLAGLLASFAEQRNLSNSEARILAYAVGGMPRARMCECFGVSSNTLKTQIRGLLGKSGERNLDRLTARILRAALPTTIVESPPLALDAAE